MTRRPVSGLPASLCRLSGVACHHGNTFQSGNLFVLILPEIFDVSLYLVGAKTITSIIGRFGDQKVACCCSKNPGVVLVFASSEYFRQKSGGDKN